MASNYPNGSQDAFNFRPRSGYNRNTSSSRGYNGNRRPIYRPVKNNNPRQRPDEYNSQGSNYKEHYIPNCFSSTQSKAIDDETRAYAVNLQLDSVEMGIIATNGQYIQEFKGLGAFNRYFGLLSPSNGFGYTLPDIWDGYFHITLAKFTTHLAPDSLEEVFRTFAYPIEHLPYISDIVFHASRLSKGSGENRSRGRQNIDFVILRIDNSPEIRSFYEKVQPLLSILKVKTQSNDWNVTRLDELHVTIRKYSNIDYNRHDLNHIPIKQFPLQFRCSHLEVKQPREQAILRFHQTGQTNYKWWSGVTEIDGKCSGCNTRVMSVNWEGFCLACGNYETIIPLWSTTGNNTRHHQIVEEHIHSNKLSQIIDISLSLSLSL